MRKIFLLLILNSGILFAQSASFDNSILIESQVDTTSFKIGEKIDYYIKISIDNNYDIKFSEKPNFLPFEVLVSFDLFFIKYQTTNNNNNMKKITVKILV